MTLYTVINYTTKCTLEWLQGDRNMRLDELCVSPQFKVCVPSQSARHLLQFRHRYQPMCKLPTFRRSPAGLPKYRSRFNNNSLYLQVCLTLSGFKYMYCTVLTHSQIEYNLLFELLVSLIIWRTAKYLLDYLQRVWMSHEALSHVFGNLMILMPRM